MFNYSLNLEKKLSQKQEENGTIFPLCPSEFFCIHTKYNLIH